MAAINASPDGYSLLFGGVSMAGDRFLNANATYDVMRDFAPVSTVVTYQFVMVVPASTPAQNVKELIAFAKSRPAKKFPSGGIGGLPYLSAALFNSKAGIDAIHVPYKSAAALYVELIDGQTDYYISPMSSALPHVHSGKVRALGVTGAKRSAMFPNVPTIAEAALPDYDVTSWMSVLAPAKTPKPIVHALNGALGQVLAAADVRERLAKVGSEPAEHARSACPAHGGRRRVVCAGHEARGHQAGIRPAGCAFALKKHLRKRITIPPANLLSDSRSHNIPHFRDENGTIRTP